MSNFDSRKKTKPVQKKNIISHADQRWSKIKTDLSTVLTEWNSLEQNSPTLSAEEQQLEKVKTMIHDLKDKLNEF